MNRATSYLLVFGLAVGSGLGSAHAQGLEAGKSELPSVEINWSALDRLGPVPTLADRLKGDVPSTPLRQQLAPSGNARPPVAFQPYQPERPAAPTRQAAEKKPAAPVAEAAPTVSPKPKAVAAKPKAEPKPKAAQRPAAPDEPDIPEVIAEPAPAPAPAPEAATKAIATESAPVSAPDSEPDSAPVAAKAAPESPKAPTKAAKAKPEQIKPESIKPESIKPEPAIAAKPEPAKPEPVVPAITQAEPVPVATPAEPEIQPAQPAAMAALTPPPAMVSPSASAPATVSTRGDTMTIRFDATETRLPGAAKGELKDLASRLVADEGLNLQLLAYAEGDDAGASKARRLSLSRALEVRKYLMEEGVRSTRIEVRALGHKTDGGHADRVDAILVGR